MGLPPRKRLLGLHCLVTRIGTHAVSVCWVHTRQQGDWPAESSYAIGQKAGQATQHRRWEIIQTFLKTWQFLQRSRRNEGQWVILVTLGKLVYVKVSVECLYGNDNRLQESKKELSGSCRSLSNKVIHWCHCDLHLRYRCLFVKLLEKRGRQGERGFKLAATFLKEQGIDISAFFKRPSGPRPGRIVPP